MKRDNLEFLSTGCESLDNLLSGGLHPREVTLVYGETATGKTALSIQCAISCARRNLKVIFVDADGTFPITRLAQIAENKTSEVSSLIFVSRLLNFDQQTLLLENLENFDLRKIALIIVDTITTLYRLKLGTVEKTYVANVQLSRQLAYLNELARAYNVSVLITSQVRNIIDSNSTSNRIQPVADHILKFWSQKKIRLETTQKMSIKRLVLEDCSSVAINNNFLYRITNKGIISLIN